MKSDKSFLEFIKGEARGRLAIIALAAVLLILIGSIGMTDEPRKTAELDERVAEICSMTEGVGDCRVMITYTDSGDVFGVAILCEGAESAQVRDRLTSLICSVFGIGSHRVEILKITD